MAMFALPTGATQKLGADHTEFNTIGAPTFPGAVAFPIADTKQHIDIQWPTIDPKKKKVLPPISSKDDANAPAPKDFPILSLTVTNLQKPKKPAPQDNSDAKFAEDLPAIMIKQLKAMNAQGSLQFIPDHERNETGFFTESNWSDSDPDTDDDDDDDAVTAIISHHGIDDSYATTSPPSGILPHPNHPHPHDQQYHHIQQLQNNAINLPKPHPHPNDRQYHRTHQPQNNTANQPNPHYAAHPSKQAHNTPDMTHTKPTKKAHKKRPKLSIHSVQSDATVQSLHTRSRQEDDTVEFQHDINDILSLNLKDKYIYMVLDHCISIILEVWNASEIAVKTATDVENALLLNAGGLYETLLDYFFNSSTAIASAIHQICCKIHVMRLLMEGTKMIHIPSNLEEFEKTFGDLTSIKISTILGTGRRRKRRRKKTKRVKRVRIDSVSKQKIAARKGTNKLGDEPMQERTLYKQESFEAKLDRVQEPDAKEEVKQQDIKKEPGLQKLKSLQSKLGLAASMNTMTSIVAARNTKREVAREELAKRLRNALKELIFQNRSTYFSYWENKQFQHQKNKKNSDNSHLEVCSPASPIGRQMSKMFKKNKTPGEVRELHDRVQCEGCGQMMDMNDEELQNSVITYAVPCTESTFFFHDEICVNLRKYKEIIRKYVSESKLAANKKSKNLPQYVKNLMQNFNSLIGIHGHETLSRPYNPFKRSKHVDADAFLVETRGKREVINDEESSGSDVFSDDDVIPAAEELSEEEMAHLTLIQREREIACIALSRDKNERIESDWEFESIPLSIQISDINIYGVVLWEFVMQQLLTKQMHSLWLLLAYFSSSLSTARAIGLLEDHLADIAKVKSICNLELVCSAVLGNASYPIACALHLSHFVWSVAERDLSRKDEFEGIATRYTVVAEKLVESVESDHLLSLFLEAPTDLNLRSVFEIAIEYEMEDFFDNNRVGRIMDHMWSTFPFLDPRMNYRTRDIDLYEMVQFLFYHPAHFYYTPVGRYWIKSLMYFLYVMLITVVAAEQSYLWHSVTTLESMMWIYNIGYILFEMMEMTFRGVEYCSDYTNYFDLFIMLNWVILGVMRFVLYSDHIGKQKDLNSTATLLYMVVFGIQICVLYCRIATIFIRTKNLGPFIRMIGEMLDDVLNFAFVSLIFFLGFTVALRYILADDATQECGSDSDINTAYTTALFVFITLMGQLEWSALESNDCFTPTRAHVAQVFVVVFSILGTMLLVNLLIAMMATTYNEKLDAKSKEVNYYRTEEIYQLAHEQAIISPPLNIVVFLFVVAWYLLEFILYLVQCASHTHYVLDIALITPVHIDYSAATSSHHIIKNPIIQYEADSREFKQFCQFCRHYMSRNGTMNEYLALFKGYRLDKDDVRVIRAMFANQGLCPKCYRPYKLYSDGTSNRLARWQVLIEVMSFYVFICCVYVPMLLILTIPALAVGAWTTLQGLADKSDEARDKANSRHRKQTNLASKNYKRLIRHIIQEETTDQMDKIQHKVDQIHNQTNTATQADQKQVNQLAIMIAQVNSRIDALFVYIHQQQAQTQHDTHQLRPRQQQQNSTTVKRNTGNLQIPVASKNKKTKLQNISFSPV